MSRRAATETHDEPARQLGRSTTRWSSGSRSRSTSPASRFNQIICIARGGHARRRRAVAHLRAAARDPVDAFVHAEGGTVRGELVIAEHMTMTAPRLGDRVLLVDDMVDSGHTLAGGASTTLPRRFPHITELQDRGAVVEGVLGVQARLSTSSTCPTIRGSTSRSRSTTRCGRSAEARLGMTARQRRLSGSPREARKAGPRDGIGDRAMRRMYWCPGRGLEPPQCCHR